MWSSYRTEFPLRYVLPGRFDGYVRGLILRLKPQKILDIGGGVYGTEALKKRGVRAYLLDPNIKNKPPWMHEKVDWGVAGRFDLIVARGSINYLNKRELSKIPRLLGPRGVFVANTFINLPPSAWTARRYKTLSGRSGVERSRYNKKQGVVEHELIPDRGARTRHRFFYYSPDDYRKIFHGAKMITHKTNSAILYFKK